MTDLVKICSGCRHEFPATQEFFNVDNSRAAKLSPYCRPCHRANNRLRDRKPSYKLRKQKKRVAARLFVNSYLINNPCISCGETNIICLQFDHLDPTKKEHNVSNMIGKGMSHIKIQAEIDKCQVLCANCHFIKTSQQFNWYDNLNNPALNHENEEK